MSKMIDLQGQTFGRLVVLQRGENNKNNKACWWCRCECGNEVLIAGIMLRSGRTKSCGCLHSDIMKHLGPMNRRKHTDQVP